MRRRLTNASMALPAAAASVPALAQTPADRPGYWHHGWDWGWGHMAFDGLMMLLFWGGIIVLIIFAIRWLGTGSPGAPVPHPPRKSPREILEERFARGGIDKDEFEERKQLLSD